MTRDRPQIQILVPTSTDAGGAESETFSLGRALAGVRVGLRSDRSWRSWFTVVDQWEALLTADGAEVVRLLAGDRAGPQGERTRADVEDWAKLVECGVVGLGN